LRQVNLVPVPLSTGLPLQTGLSEAGSGWSNRRRKI